VDLHRTGRRKRYHADSCRRRTAYVLHKLKGAARQRYRDEHRRRITRQDTVRMRTLAAA
jgi:hypothetical protein